MSHNRNLCRRLPALLLAALVFASVPLHAAPSRLAAPVWRVAVLGERILSWIRGAIDLGPGNPTKEGMSIDPNGQPTQDGHDGDEGITIDPNG